MKSNWFERNPKKTAAAVIVLVVGFVEVASYGVIASSGVDLDAYPFNRTLSGYYVTKSAPNFRFAKTIKSDPEQPDVQFDDHGFVSDRPVRLEKPANTVRAFLLGGSAMLGASQNPRYASIHPYGQGVYTYDLSIAGQLRSFLTAQDPDTDYEVITAATHNRMLHQSMHYYLETVSRFSPDYVVNLDGYNDIFSIVSGTPYQDLANDLPAYVRLLESARNQSPLRSFRLLKVWYRDFVGNRVQEAMIEKTQQLDLTPADATVDAYLKLKDRLVDTGSGFVKTLSRYMAVLDEDNVGFIFVLQPMLGRATLNKQLSPSERLMDAIPPFPRSSRETSSLDTEDPEYAERWHMGMLVLRYLFDDYLAAELQQESAKAGHTFIDMGREIQELDATFEFFTDYCHLTPQANRHTAEKVGRAILARSRTEVTEDR